MNKNFIRYKKDLNYLYGEDYFFKNYLYDKSYLHNKMITFYYGEEIKFPRKRKRKLQRHKRLIKDLLKTYCNNDMKMTKTCFGEYISRGGTHIF